MLYPSYSNPIKARLLEDTGHEDFHYTKPGYRCPKSKDFQAQLLLVLTIHAELCASPFSKDVLASQNGS